MSWLVRRSIILFGAGIVTGVVSVLIWPGDLNDEPMTWGHRIAVLGFLFTAILLVLGAIMLVIAVVGTAWKVDDFDLGDYLDDMKRDR
jgi:hypothetical protein